MAVVDAAGTVVMTGPVGSIIVTYRVHEEDGEYVAECPELCVASCGDTIDDAFHMIADAVELYLNSLEEEGERERVFRERNVNVFQDEAQGAAFVSTGLNEYVKRQVVPVHLFAAA